MTTSSKARIAIVTGLLKNRQTFVNRHIRCLNQGETVVLCQKIVDDMKLSVPVLEFGSSYEHTSYLGRLKKFKQLLTHGHQLVPDKSVKKRIHSFLLDNNVTVVLAEFGTYGCLIYPVAKEINLPVYTYFRGYDASKNLKSWSCRYSYRKFVKQMDGVIAVSRHLLDNLNDIGAYNNNSHVIPSGVDTDRFVPDEKKDKNLFVSVGRFVEKKAPKITIRAFSKIANDYPEIHLEMIGGGKLLDECKELVSTLNLSDRIKFLGSQSHDVISYKLAKASFYLQHSVTPDSGDSEGLPSAMQEALSSGAVVIATRHGGIPEAIDHRVTGLLVDEYDVDGYVKQIKTVLSDRKLAEEIAKNGRALAVKEFDSKKLIEKLESILFKKTSSLDF